MSAETLAKDERATLNTTGARLRIHVWFWILVSLATARPGPLWEPLWAELPRLQGDGFKETTHQTLDVSGVYLISVMQGDGFHRPNPREMFVWLPEQGSDYLCVAVRSVDGVYNAEDRFPIAGKAAGRYALAFDAKLRDTLLTYQPGELVLDGRIGPTCDRPDRLHHVPMAWTPDAAPSRLVFFINDDGHDGFLFFPHSANAEQLQKIPCRELDTRLPRRTFSAFCVLESLEGLDVFAGWLEIRRYGDRIAWENLGVFTP